MKYSESRLKTEMASAQERFRKMQAKWRAHARRHKAMTAQWSTLVHVVNRTKLYHKVKKSQRAALNVNPFVLVRRINEVSNYN